jgi:hypothetical protein
MTGTHLINTRPALGAMFSGSIGFQKGRENAIRSARQIGPTSPFPIYEIASSEAAESTIHREATIPMVSPDGLRLLARRPGRELFPASWLQRRVRISYDDGSGTTKGEDLCGILLEWCGAGLIVQANGSKNLLSWKRLTFLELGEEES